MRCSCACCPAVTMVNVYALQSVAMYVCMYVGSEECGGVLILLQEEIKFPARLSEVSKSVLGKLLEKDPSKRWVSEREGKRGGG